MDQTRAIPQPDAGRPAPIPGRVTLAGHKADEEVMNDSRHRNFR